MLAESRRQVASGLHYMLDGDPDCSAAERGRKMDLTLPVSALDRRGRGVARAAGPRGAGAAGAIGPDRRRDVAGAARRRGGASPAPDPLAAGERLGPPARSSGAAPGSPGLD